MGKKIIAVLLALMLVLAVAGCGGAGAASKNYIMATGGTSGTYYPFGGAIAQIINKNAQVNITANATGASKENIRLIATKEADLAIVQNDVLDYAAKGIELFEGEKVENLAVIGTLYPEVVQLVATSDIKTVADLKGKRVSVGDVGSGVEANAKQILEAYGITFNDIKVNNLSFKESSNAFQDGQLDAFFVTSGIPNTAIVELSVTNPVNIINVEDAQRASLIEKYPFYVDFEVGSDVYKTESSAKTLAMKATLICRADLPEDVVYNMTKALFENLPELESAHAKGAEVSVENAVTGVSVDFHPGALKYYKEKGLV